MEHTSLNEIYSEIQHLSNSDRQTLYNRMKNEFYGNTEIVAYTTDGEPLSLDEYRKRVEIGIEQCVKNEGISLENLSKELGYIYESL
ncbi:MAG: hypothetical protein LBE36_04445 [Flavobacteriaceae bacterium]|jgi:hypothetical protein|nr:hypothetical protein [Flavobacteriaceae bacterium]